jgi:hypothetical protein
MRLVKINPTFRSAHVIIVILLICGFTVNYAWSQPQTDGNVCNRFRGAAYGLCNAYSNAMKCGTDQQNTSNKVCDRVLYNFRDIQTYYTH